MKQFLYSLSAVCVLFLSAVSCTKIRATDLGGDLIPAVDNLSVFDTTLEVITELYQMPDSTRIRYNQNHAIGILQDPSFGTTTGEAYLQLEPLSFGAYPFGKSRDSIVGLDSVVLSLSYRTLYGDSNSIQTLRVFEIDPNSPFRDSSLGYQVSHPAFDVTDELGAKENILFSTLNDSIRYINIKDTVKTVNELRIPLSTAFGLKLMNLDTTDFKTDTTFRLKFKGLAIRPDAASALKRAIAYFNFSDAATHLRFHYRRIRNGGIDTTTTDFSFRNYSNANLLNRDIAGSPYESKLQNGATGNQEELYIQSTPGSFALLKIPGLENLSNRVVYKASLIAEQIPGVDDNFFLQPNLLFLDAVDSVNKKFYTIPNSWVLEDNTTYGYSPEYFGGFLKNGKYQFDLSRYVQGIVTRKEKSYTLRLHAPFVTIPTISGTSDITRILTLNPLLGGGRVILGGGAHPVKKLRLYIIYSKI